MLVDTHAHLDQDEFADDLGDVVARAAEVGVERIIAIGVTADSSARCAELAAQFPAVRAAVGIQPNYVAEAQPGDWERVVEMAGAPGVVALGETGLDRYWDHTPLEQQRDLFDRHVRLSQEIGLPFIVHMRDCQEDILQMLREARHRAPLQGVMHSFTGGAEMAAECVSMGLFISFAGMVTFKKSSDLRDVAAAIPDDRLLIETDSPYLSPEPVRKVRRNEPAHVVHTAQCIADARGVTLSELAQLTTQNAQQLFALT